MLHAPTCRVVLALMFPAACLMWACGGTASSTPVSPTNVPLPALDVMLADKVLGSSSATVTMIEYSSLTCPHCADFNASTLPQIKSTYIDSGKVRLVFRDFPLDNSALSASMVARCSGDQFFTVIDLLFRSQSTWASSGDPVSAMKPVVAQAGVAGAVVDACVASTDLRNGILAMRAAGQSQYSVDATPTFIIGSQTVVGALPFATFDAILKSLTQ